MGSQLGSSPGTGGSATTDASLLTSGTLAAARLPTAISAANLADGTVGNTDLQCIKDLATTGGTGHALLQSTVGGAITTGVPSATDSTKLPKDGSSSMTGALQFTGTQTSAGATISNIWRDSAGTITTNVPSGAQFVCLVGGSTAHTVSIDGIFLPTTQTNYGSYRQIAGTSLGLEVNSPATLRSTLSAGGVGTTLPEVCVYGASHAGSPGAVEIKANAPTIANDSAWHNAYSLSKGTHNGTFWVYDDNGSVAIFNITGTTITFYASWVNTFWGSTDVSHRNLRVSAGSVQVYNGSSLVAGKIALIFHGTVV